MRGTDGVSERKRKKEQKRERKKRVRERRRAIEAVKIDRDS